MCKVFYRPSPLTQSPVWALLMQDAAFSFETAAKFAVFRP